MATIGDLITESFELAGIDNPTSSQYDKALNSLNNMVSFMGAEFLAYAVTSETLSLTEGDEEYTIGSSGDLNTTRPVKVENLYLQDSNGYDWPLEPLSAKGYNAIHNKSFQARPEKFYFLPEYPLAKIIFDNKPDATYTACFEFHKPVTEFAATSATYAVPPEYKEYFIYNLCIKICEKWDRIVKKSVESRAAETQRAIERLNAINRGSAEVSFEVPVSDNSFFADIDSGV